MSRIDGAARPRTAASPVDVVPTLTQRLTPRRGVPRSIPAGTGSEMAAKWSRVTEPARLAVAGVNARTAPQNGDSMTVAPWEIEVCPSRPPKRHMSLPGFTTNPVAPWFVPAFTVWLVDPRVMLPACVDVGGVHALTAPQASVGARNSTAGALGVGAAAGIATVPQAASRIESASARSDFTAIDASALSYYYVLVGGGR